MTSNHTNASDSAGSQNRPFPWRCPECGKKEVWPAILSHTSEIKHDGRLHVVTVPRLRVPRCRACGELVHDNEADEQIAKALRDKLGLLSSEQIRKNRDALGISQRALAEQLGVAVETISRWETGALTQTKAMDRYLRVYFGVPAARAALVDDVAGSQLGVHVET